LASTRKQNDKENTCTTTTTSTSCASRELNLLASGDDDARTLDEALSITSESPDDLRVFARVKPAKLRDCARAVQVERARACGRSSVLSSPAGRFACHGVFDKESNAKIFARVGQPLVHAVLAGYHGTLLAYGQSGSGKTHTMGDLALAGTANEGLVPQALRHLFARVESAPADIEYEVSMQYLLLHADRVHDLLSEGRGQPVVLREEPSGAVVAQGARTIPLRSVTDALSALTAGAAQMRLVERPSARSHSVCIVAVSRRQSEAARRDAAAAAVARTASADESAAPCVRVSLRAANRGSERGCAVSVCIAASAAPFAPTRQNLDGLTHTLQLAQRTHTALQGKLTMVDLAGSERKGLKSPAGQSAGVHKVNEVSIAALGSVIASLARDEPCYSAPFRSSPLTRLLQEPLCNGRTSLLLCLSPAQADAAESRCTLQLGSRAMAITRNTAAPNSMLDVGALAEHLQRPLHALEQQLVEAQHRLATSTNAHQARVAALEAEVAERESQVCALRRYCAGAQRESVEAESLREQLALARQSVDQTCEELEAANGAAAQAQSQAAAVERRAAEAEGKASQAESAARSARIAADASREREAEMLRAKTEAERALNSALEQCARADAATIEAAGATQRAEARVGEARAEAAASAQAAAAMAAAKSAAELEARRVLEAAMARADAEETPEVADCAELGGPAIDAVQEAASQTARRTARHERATLLDFACTKLGVPWRGRYARVLRVCGDGVSTLDPGSGAVTNVWPWSRVVACDAVAGSTTRLALQIAVGGEDDAGRVAPPVACVLQAVDGLASMLCSRSSLQFEALDKATCQQVLECITQGRHRAISSDVNGAW
jgi:hypothetical protein